MFLYAFTSNRGLRASLSDEYFAKLERKYHNAKYYPRMSLIFMLVFPKKHLAARSVGTNCAWRMSSFGVS